MISIYIMKEFKQIKYYKCFNNALVAQLDRALDYGSGGSGSNPSRRTNHEKKDFFRTNFLYFISVTYY